MCLIFCSSFAPTPWIWATSRSLLCWSSGDTEMPKPPRPQCVRHIYLRICICLSAEARVSPDTGGSTSCKLLETMKHQPVSVPVWWAITDLPHCENLPVSQKTSSKYETRTSLEDKSTWKSKKYIVPWKTNQLLSENIDFCKSEWGLHPPPFQW